MKIPKLYTVITYAALSLATSAFAQESVSVTPRDSSSPDRFVRRAIVQASLANAGLEGGDSTRYTKPNGYTAGLLFDLVGQDNLVLETGVMYRQFGTSIDDGLGENKLTANYISVPISAKYYLSSQELSSLYIKGGVMGSTLTSDNTLYSTPTRRIGARSWESAVLAGLGAKINLTDSTDMVLEANYNRALDSLYDDSTVYRSDLSAALGFAVNL